MAGSTPLSRRFSRAVSNDIAVAVVVGAAYWLAAELGLQLALIERNITPLWPPSGIAVVALLRFGRRLWPAIAIAAFLVNLPISESALAAAATAVGNTIAPLIAATLLLATGFHTRMDRPRDVVALVGLAALLSMVFSATIGSGTLVLSDAIADDRFPSAWSVWWTGDAVGVLVFAPLLLLLSTIRVDRRVAFRWSTALEAGALGVLVLVVAAYAVTSDVQMLFLVLPVVGWVAWRFGQAGAAPAVVIVCVAATWAAVEGRGPFAGSPLSDTMLKLQAFNVSIALTAFLLAAVVEERTRARRALERAAADLESRVGRRTAELSAANERLEREVAERREAEIRLRRSQRALAEAHEVARIGTWEWDVRTGEVQWSDEMYRIYGAEPQSFPVTFDKAMERVPADDQSRIRENVQSALESGRRRVGDIEYRVVFPDGQTRHLFGRARLTRDADGTPVRMLGIVQDVTERRQFEREHRIADTLQTALLPRSFDDIDGVELSARYVPAEVGFNAGGDWYDVIPITPSTVALVIGDVAGHGLEAASLMGQLRMAIRAYALENHPPHVVAARGEALLRELAPDQMVTMLYIVLDLDTLDGRLVNAGHPPPLVVNGDVASFLDAPPGPPLGMGGHPRFTETSVRIEPGSTLVLYTDGLVDRRDLALDEGLERLVRIAGEHAASDAEGLCDLLLAEMVPGDVTDDVALLAFRQLPVPAGGVHLRIDAEPRTLARVRRSLHRWLSVNGIPSSVSQEIVLASTEAVTNSIRHAYGPGSGWVEIQARLDDGHVDVEVRDGGGWRPLRGGDGGRGLGMIHACMPEVTIERGRSGTTVRMRRPVSREERR
jgi:PAS domain S-box-containing protein